MSEELEAEIFTAKVILIGGMVFLGAVLLIAFIIIAVALRRKAKREVILQEFLKENRSNGKHVEYGEPHSKP